MRSHCRVSGLHITNKLVIRFLDSESHAMLYQTVLTSSAIVSTAGGVDIMSVFQHTVGR